MNNKCRPRKLKWSSILKKKLDSPTINWNGNWAYACNFVTTNSDIMSDTSPSKCSFLCSTNHACTHYNWVSYKGGHCFLKSGLVNKSMAMNTNNNKGLVTLATS